MAAADKWEREKDDFRKDSGSFCGSCTEWVRRLVWGWWVLFGGRDVRARGGARQPPNGRRPRGPFGGGAPPPRAAAARRRAAAQRPPDFFRPVALLGPSGGVDRAELRASVQMSLF